MKNLFIGLLSGTSMDAIDAALVDFSNPKPNLIHAINHPIPENFRTRCLQITQEGQCSLDEYGCLDVEAGEIFANAAKELLQQAGIQSEQVRGLGSHGQNLRHRPDLKTPFTLQIGDPNIISERTGILTIADFRRRDLACGGKGAPLAPAFHAHVFRDPQKNRVILNIGGISNISLLPSENQKGNRVTGFDTGPGNCLLDAWIQEQLQQPFDRNGEYANSGKIQTELLELCLSDPYFSKAPPKSTGREYFNLTWFKQYLQDFMTPNHVQATLLALTRESIARAIEETAPFDSEIWVCGGGAHNRVLINQLSERLKKPVNSTEILGIAPDWVEAMLFAWLAKQTLEGKIGNCPDVTGANRAVSLGGIFGFTPRYGI